MITTKKLKYALHQVANVPLDTRGNEIDSAVQEIERMAKHSISKTSDNIRM